MHDNLAEEYFRSAEETVRVANLIKESGSNMWLATQTYYAEYLAACSLLMKIGIISKIHSCTIEVIRVLEQEKVIGFNFSEILTHDKEMRIDNQYSLKNRAVDFSPKRLALLLIEVRKALDSLTEEQKENIRGIIARASSSDV